VIRALVTEHTRFALLTNEKRCGPKATGRAPDAANPDGTKNLAFGHDF
jgi:hypothetical protein